MSRLFNSGTPDYFNAASAAITAVPFSLSAWVNPTSVVTSQTVIEIYDSAGELDKFLFYLGSSSQVTLQSRRGAAIAQSTAGTLVANVWQHVGAVSSATNSRFSFLNGTKGTENTTTAVPTSLDSTSIGMDRDTTPGNAFNGMIAEVAIWNVAISDNEMVALSRGQSPLRIRRSSLVHYWPLWGNHSPEIPAIRGSFEMTASGGPSRGNHAPVRLFSRSVTSAQQVTAPSTSVAAQYYYYLSTAQ